MMSHTDDEELRAYRSEYTAFVEPGDVVTYNANLGEQPDEGTRRRACRRCPRTT